MSDQHDSLKWLQEPEPMRMIHAFSGKNRTAVCGQHREFLLGIQPPIFVPLTSIRDITTATFCYDCVYPQKERIAEFERRRESLRAELVQKGGEE